MNKLDIFKTLAAEASKGELVFPTNVNATLKLQRMLDDPDCHIDTAAKLIMDDPLVAAKTVALANSVAYNRSGNEITSVKLAVNRLGFRTMKSLVASVIVRQLSCEITNPALKAKANQLWEHTAHVAALAQVIARHVTRVDPDTAMFAAIVHEIGGFYLISRAQEHPGLLDGEPEAWTEYSEKLIGRSVMKQLGIPVSVVQAVEALWHGYCAFPALSLGDTLLLADDLAPVRSPLHETDEMSKRRISMIIDFDIEDTNFQSLMTESESEVDSLRSALMV